MIEKLDGFSVQWKVVCMLIVEEVNSMLVQAKAQGLEERDVVSHYLLIGKVKLVNSKEEN